MARGKAKDTRNLRLRGNVWFFQKRLSPALSKHLGKKVLQQSTQTGDLDSACRVRDKLLVELAELEDSLLGRTSPIQQRRQFIEARQKLQEAQKELVDQGLDVLEVVDPDKLREPERDALRYLENQQVPDQYRLTLKGALEDWLHSPFVQRKSTTRSKNQFAVGQFLKHLGEEDVTMISITRQQVREFITDRLKDGKSRQTVANYLSAMSAIWGHAETVMDEQLPSNPFKRHELNPKATVRSHELFTREDVEAIFKATEEESGIYHLLPRMGFYTGARIEDLCSLEVTDVTQHQGVWCVSVRDGKGKNSNATRDIPLHSAIKQPVLDQLKHAHSVGSRYLFPEAEASIRADGKKGPKFSQWFSRLLSKTVHKRGRKVSFHSFRTTAITIMLGAGFQEQLVVWVTGHERGMTTAAKVYHRGPAFSERLRAVESISIDAIPCLSPAA